MSYDYNSLYRQTPDALGAPSDVFVRFFQNLETPHQKVLDIGCGQGRDALFIARLGHSVTGVDLAPHGIRDLTKAAKAEGLDITGITADITDYTPDGLFDIILIDRTLHMLAPETRHRVLDRLLPHIAANGWLLIADEAKNIPAFARLVEEFAAPFTIHKHTKGIFFAQRTA